MSEYPSEAAREADEFIKGLRHRISPAAARIIEHERRHELRKVYGTSFYESGPIHPQDIKHETE